MPFMYELKLAAKEPSYTFVQQLISVGSVADVGRPVCTLTDGTMEFHVMAPKLGLIVEWFVEHGAAIENGDSLARIVCEGDKVAVPAAVPVRLG
ncbi:MAG: biotin/lipoyl-containing protein [Edaphobacter sp.]